MSEDLNEFFKETSKKKRDFPALIARSTDSYVVYSQTGTGTNYDETFSAFNTYLNQTLSESLLATFSEKDNKAVCNWLEILPDEALVELMMPEDIVKMAPSFSLTWTNGQNYEMRFEGIKTNTTYDYVLIWLEPHGETQEQQLAAKIIDLLREVRQLPREVINNLKEYIPEMQEQLTLDHYAKYHNDPTLIQQISRNLHAAKGTVFFLGLSTLGNACHEAETQLANIKDDWTPNDGLAPVRESLNQLVFLTSLTEGIVTHIQPDSSEGEHVVIPVEDYYQLLELSLTIQNTAKETNTEYEHLYQRMDQLHRRLIRFDSNPIEDLFVRLNTSTSKLAKELKKTVKFIVQSHYVDIYLPRHVFEGLWNAFFQILKNAIDHGIEPKDLRKAVDKPEIAQIVFSIEVSNDSLTLRMKDDGKGIDANEILQTAVKKKLLTSKEADTFKVTGDVQKIYELLLLPQFTTQKSVTTVSGRGMGTNVIQQEVEEYSGSVAISSELGQWTQFTIVLPIKENNITVEDSG